MVSDFISKIDKFIRWSFYILFFFVPLIMWPDTSELFEFNKMWFVFGMTLLIGFLWGAKMITQKRFEIRRTPLDIPLILFFLSQLISTIYSMEPHTSFWGYYSRFNGGLLSTIAYLFLYYAFATNLTKNTNSETHKDPISYKLLAVSLLSGLAVTLWGLPSHFGLDPTCFAFRGTLDTSCWTPDFQPTVRMFSTLGQPNWLGTYLAALIPISLGFGIFKLPDRNKLAASGYLLLTFLFYLALLYTRSQSSFLGLAIGLVIFFGVLLFKNFKELKQKFSKNKLSQYFIASILILAVTSFFISTPIDSLNKFTTLSGIQNLLSKPTASSQTQTAKTAGSLDTTSSIQLGGTESSKIRLIVWKGALEIFQQHPLFGTGVETFAYAYYQVKPVEHNLTSEWDFLYNKAHNEYLNYLATTGAFGLLTYLSIIGVFFYYALKRIFRKGEDQYFPISLGILAGFIAMLISNFFGFSVVVINLFIFVFPILYFDFEENKSLKKTFSIPKTYEDHLSAKVPPPAVIFMVILGLVALYYEFFLLNFWNADRSYALGYNLDKASEYPQAYPHLTDAVKMLPQEDLYKDELSINMATLSLLLADQKDATQAAQFGQQAKILSDQINAAHPNNIVFLKTRARVAFALSEVDPAGIDLAIQTIEQARKLAPTDAKLVYNEGIFYSQKGDSTNAINYVKQAIVLKPNYLDAYYTLALLYADQAKKGGPDAADYKQKEKDALEYILKNIDPTHKASQELLKTL